MTKWLWKDVLIGYKNIIECKSYMKNEDIPGNKEIFVYGVKHNETGTIDKYIKNWMRVKWIIWKQYSIQFLV